MKSQRRHELKTNPLAVWTEQALRQLLPYWKLITAGVVVVAVVWLGTLILKARQEAHLEQGWDRLFAVLRAEHLNELVQQLQEAEETKDLRPEEQRRQAVVRLADELDAIARTYAGTPVAIYARMELGDIYYALGLSSLFEDLEQAREYLDRSVESYRQVVNTPLLEAQMIARARFRLAQALEARGRSSRDDAPHDWQLAQQEYELLTRSPNVFHQLAQSRLEAMRRGRFHQWFWDMIEPEQ